MEPKTTQPTMMVDLGNVMKMPLPTAERKCSSNFT